MCLIVQRLSRSFLFRAGHRKTNHIDFMILKTHNSLCGYENLTQTCKTITFSLGRLWFVVLFDVQIRIVLQTRSHLGIANVISFLHLQFPMVT